MKDLAYRMYGFVARSLSDKQKGIQFGHAVVEYAQKHFNDSDYQDWASKDKTFIMLDGGSTNSSIEKRGSLNEIFQKLSGNKIQCEAFYEEDLNDAMTALVFLVDERVWNRKTYLDFTEWMQLDENAFTDGEGWIQQFHAQSKEELDRILFLRDFLKSCKTA